MSKIRSLHISALSVSLFALAACGGGGNLADEAEKRADTTCACENFDCTTEQIGWFNEVSITQEEDLLKLSTEDQERYVSASLRAADCQDALR